MVKKGVVAAGHLETAESARSVLEAGGNAYDAAMAAFFSACVVEPVLASPGGGGYLLTGGKQPFILFDFFCQTPHRHMEGEVDFRPIEVDFGTTAQEFHIGMGSAATPGSIMGIFAVQKELGRMSPKELVKPALKVARKGVVTKGIAPYLFQLVSPIFLSSERARTIYGSRIMPGKILQNGEVLKQDALADFLEILAGEGPDLFYRGPIAREIVEACKARGGHLTEMDFNRYEIARRKPLEINYRSAKIRTNPAPSLGGTLIGLSLNLLSPYDLPGTEFGTMAHLDPLIRSMEVINSVKRNSAHEVPENIFRAQSLADDECYRSYLDTIASHSINSRGTTHVSIMDGEGNIASMTLTNGEGCGYIPKSGGFMLNNMLGEEDLNPAGFHQWIPNRRLASMMAPCIIEDENRTIATGSGGSNRIRTALLQVILNCTDFSFPVEKAVSAPRVHFEHGILYMEQGYQTETMKALQSLYPEVETWADLNLFFGGAHTVYWDRKGRYGGAGDPRRDGVCLNIPSPP